MSWRELVNWNPEPSTQFTHNTHNSRNWSSEFDSAESALSTLDMGHSRLRGLL